VCDKVIKQYWFNFKLGNLQYASCDVYYFKNIVFLSVCLSVCLSIRVCQLFIGVSQVKLVSYLVPPLYSVFIVRYRPTACVHLYIIST
jgi:hypothetical protein